MTISFLLLLLLPAHRPHLSQDVRAPFSLAAGQPISFEAFDSALRLALNVRQPQALASKWSLSLSQLAMHNRAKAWNLGSRHWWL